MQHLQLLHPGQVDHQAAVAVDISWSLSPQRPVSPVDLDSLCPGTLAAVLARVNALRAALKKSAAAGWGAGLAVQDFSERAGRATRGYSMRERRLAPGAMAEDALGGCCPPAAANACISRFGGTVMGLATGCYLHLCSEGSVQGSGALCLLERSGTYTCQGPWQHRPSTTGCWLSNEDVFGSRKPKACTAEHHSMAQAMPSFQDACGAESAMDELGESDGGRGSRRDRAARRAGRTSHRTSPSPLGTSPAVKSALLHL